MRMIENLFTIYVRGVLIFFGAVWLISVILTIADKLQAKHGGRRVPERTLIILGLIGGALPMYLTMRAIRHKTLHKKFMIGLPAIMILHILLLIFGFILLTNMG